MNALPIAVYLLCIGTSLACAVLLTRSYRRTGGMLLLWSALCFFGLALNNLVLFLDIVVLPAIDLQVLRYLVTLAAIGILLYGFIWETD